MASLNLDTDELRAVESSRQRLSQLSNSIASLRADVFTTSPLPTLESLQASADILRLNLDNLFQITSQNNELFSRIAVHPSTNYPGRTQEGVLLQLLRKKPEPDVAALMDQGRTAAASLDAGPSQKIASSEHEAKSELEGIWAAAGEICRKRIHDYVMEESDDPFTAAERDMGIENVRTGLRRKLEDDEDDDEDDEENGVGQPPGAGGVGGDAMVLDRPPPPPAPGVVPQEVQGATLENILRFAARGEFVAG